MKKSGHFFEEKSYFFFFFFFFLGGGGGGGGVEDCGSYSLKVIINKAIGRVGKGVTGELFSDSSHKQSHWEGGHGGAIL